MNRKTLPLLHVVGINIALTTLLSQSPLPTGYGLEGPGSNPDSGKRFISCPKRSDRLRSPPILLFKVFRCSFRRMKRHDVMLPSHLHLVQRLKLSGAIHCTPLIRLHGVYRNNSSFCLLPLVPRIRRLELYNHCPISLYSFQRIIRFTST